MQVIMKNGVHGFLYNVSCQLASKFMCCLFVHRSNCTFIPLPPKREGFMGLGLSSCRPSCHMYNLVVFWLKCWKWFAIWMMPSATVSESSYRSKTYQTYSQIMFPRLVPGKAKMVQADTTSNSVGLMVYTSCTPLLPAEDVKESLCTLWWSDWLSDQKRTQGPFQGQKRWLRQGMCRELSRAVLANRLTDVLRQVGWSSPLRRDKRKLQRPWTRRGKGNMRHTVPQFMAGV